MIIALIAVSAGGQTDPLLRSRSLMSVGKYDSAVQILSMAIGNQPGNTDLYYDRGICNFELKRYDKALGDFLFVNKRTSGKASLMLARTEARLNHPEIAVKYLRQHLSSYYKQSESDLLLDEDLQLLENTDAWKQLWREKDWYSAYDMEMQEIEYLMSNRENLEAINRLNELNGTGYKKTLVNQYLAELYLASGNEKAAMDAINRSIAANGRNTEALKIRIKLNKSAENFEKAATDCNQLLRLDPSSFDYYLTSGKLLSRTGEYDQALKQVQTYMELFPGSHSAYNVQGEIHYENGQFLEALKSFNQALKDESGNAEYFFNRGRAYAATGTYRYAEKDFSMALDLDPLNPEIWFEKGMADLELEDIQTACFDFKKAFRYGKYDAKDFIDKLCNN